jgi:hypothetical protein
MTEPKKPAARRVYLVEDAAGEKHLVNAASPAQAVGVVYKPLVRVASQMDLLALRDVEVEEAA